MGEKKTIRGEDKENKKKIWGKKEYKVKVMITLKILI